MLRKKDWAPNPKSSRTDEGQEAADQKDSRNQTANKGNSHELS